MLTMLSEVVGFAFVINFNLLTPDLGSSRLFFQIYFKFHGFQLVFMLWLNKVTISIIYLMWIVIFCVLFVHFQSKNTGTINNFFFFLYWAKLYTYLHTNIYFWRSDANAKPIFVKILIFYRCAQCQGVLIMQFHFLSDVLLVVWFRCRLSYLISLVVVHWFLLFRLELVI